MIAQRANWCFAASVLAAISLKLIVVSGYALFVLAAGFLALFRRA